MLSEGKHRHLPEKEKDVCSIRNRKTVQFLGESGGSFPRSPSILHRLTFFQKPWEINAFGTFWKNNSANFVST